jgi:hypothetical protein
MPGSSSESAPVATFVFQGTVRKVKSSTLKEIPVDDQTLVVTVDNVIEAPKSLAKLGGSEITVQLTGNQKASVGETLIFHSGGWIFGDSVAVQCISKEAVKATHAALLTRGGNPVEHRRDRVVQKRFSDSDTCVSGTVETVKLPEESIPRRRAARTTTEPVEIGPVSEHNPRWREAVIAIDKTHKGGTDKDRLVIRFPSSTDVRWYKAPKFAPGQQGYFMLQKTKVSEKLPSKATKKAAKAAGAAIAFAVEEKPEAAEVYTALHPEDFQSYSEPGGIRRVLELTSDESDG